VNSIEPDVLRQAIYGNELAYGTIIESFQKPVFNLCYRMLGNTEAAEDAAQETFWRAYQSLKKYNPERPFGTWLLSIAAHYCIDQHRKKKLPMLDMDDYVAEITPDHNMPNPEFMVMKKDHEMQIQSLLNELSELDRASIILRYWHEYSEEEISQVLDITVNAVKSRLHRARKKLAVAWQVQNPPVATTERIKHGSPAF